MEKKLRVIVADSTDNFGKPCRNALRNHGIDAECIDKDGKRLIDTVIKVILTAALGVILVKVGLN